MTEPEAAETLLRLRGRVERVRKVRVALVPVFPLSSVEETWYW
jgi:hypothetical protein